MSRKSKISERRQKEEDGEEQDFGEEKEEEGCKMRKRLCNEMRQRLSPATRP